MPFASKALYLGWECVACCSRLIIYIRCGLLYICCGLLFLKTRLASLLGGEH